MPIIILKDEKLRFIRALKAQQSIIAELKELH